MNSMTQPNSCLAKSNTLSPLLLIASMAVVSACGGGSDSGSEGSSANTGADDLPADLNVLGTLEDFPGGDATTAGGQTDIDPSALEGTVGLIVDSEQRCAPVFEPVQVVVTRQLEEGEQANSAGELPNISAFVKFLQGFGTSLNLVSRTDEGVNFEINKQDIGSLTAFIDNGSVTTFLAGYDRENPDSFILQKPIDGGCLYAFKSQDFCTAGLSTTGTFATSRNGASMSALGCELDNPNDLPVIELPPE